MQAIINGISGIIPGGISIVDFAIIAKTDQITAQQILNELVANNIGTKENNMYNFTEGDRLKTAIYALYKGASIDEVAAKVSWKDFEGLVAEILEINDFATMKNFMLKKPRMEIDVIGIKQGIAMLIDCKHWKYTTPSALQKIVQKQIERTKHYVASTEGSMAIPVIVTLYQDKINFINKVPIVPIFQLSSFIEEFYGNIENMETIEKDL